MTRVLFISSANRNGINPIVTAQGISLSDAGLDVHYYGILGKGAAGYLKNIGKIRKTVRDVQPDIIHAHFSFSGFAASLAAQGKPVVVSLMGSDVAGGWVHRFPTKFFSRFLWARTIVKSEWMAKRTLSRRIAVIPNGVDLKRFFPTNDRSALKRKCGLSADKKHILFFADPNRYSKNYTLAQQAMRHASIDDAELVVKFDVSHGDMPELINAADMVLLTSRWEGSPNVVKEAMACNCPVVATSVGDVAWLFGNETGYYTADFNPQNIGNRISGVMQLLDDGVQINGRQRIIRLGLDSESIASRLIKVYEEVLKSDEY